MKKISYILLTALIAIAFILCMNMKQNVNFKKIFTKESAETKNLKCSVSVIGQWHKYVLDKKTTLNCYEEPYDLIFRFVTSDKNFKAVRIDRCEIKYQNVSLPSDTVDFKNVVKQFETAKKTGDKELYICLANIVNHHNHFNCIIHATIIDVNNKETKQILEFNFSTDYKGNRNFAVIEAISSI